MDPVMKAALQIKRVTVDPSLKLYIPFNEGTGGVAKDYSQYGNNGVLTDVEWGINGGVFNGTSAYLDCGNDPSLDITDAITIEAWVKPVDVTTAGTIFSRSSGNSGYELRMETSHDPDQMTFFIADGTSWRGASDASNVLISNKWQHVAGTYDGTNVRLYIDGALVGGPTASNAPPSVDAISRIGSRPGYWFFNGVIDGVKIYNRALSALEILNDYEAERGRYCI